MHGGKGRNANIQLKHEDKKEEEEAGEERDPPVSFQF